MMDFLGGYFPHAWVTMCIQEGAPDVKEHRRDQN